MADSHAPRPSFPTLPGGTAPISGAHPSSPPPSAIPPPVSSASPTSSGGRARKVSDGPPASAQKIGGHKVLRHLGTGPLCTAYEVERLGFTGGPLARGVLRLLNRPTTENERARSQFVRAAYAANRVQHPRVLGVAEDGVHDGAPFVLRVSVDGEPLPELLVRQGRLHEQQALVIAEQLLDVIEIAHAHGVVHGAIAPANVLVTARGSTRVCDFAVPPSHRGHVEEDPDVLARFHVSPWTAPERCGEEPPPATEAGDVYAIAATIFFAVTGEAPRGSANDRASLATTPARRVRDVAPSVGEAFAAVIDHALATQPSRRYESAYAMLGDVRRVLARRAPKLGEARQPNPSGSYSGMRVPASLARQPSLSPGPVSLNSADLAPTSRRSPSIRPQEWRGNAMLILAIALLVGIATFVVVRERVEESRGPHAPSGEGD